MHDQRIQCVLVGARQAARKGDYYEVRQLKEEAIRLASKIPREERDGAYRVVDAIGEIARADKEYC